MATDPTIVSTAKANGIYKVCITAFSYPFSTLFNFSGPIDSLIFDNPAFWRASTFVPGEAAFISLARRSWNSVAEAQIHKAEPIPAPNVRTAPPRETSSMGRTAWRAIMGLLRPRPTARPRKASRITALVICSSRSIVVSKPEIIGVRILVAIMNAVNVSFGSMGV